MNWEKLDELIFEWLHTSSKSHDSEYIHIEMMIAKYGQSLLDRDNGDIYWQGSVEVKFKQDVTTLERLRESKRQRELDIKMWEWEWKLETQVETNNQRFLKNNFQDS